jgi:uncharacterized membrane protein
MTLWLWIIISSAVAYLTKLLGYLVPRKWLKNPRILRIASTLTIGLLAALVASNTFASGQHLVADARIGALVAAVIALLLRAPFLVVVLVGALAAAGLRLLGFP